MQSIMFLTCSNEPTARAWLIGQGIARGDDE
jgi:hypothetical protein